MKPLPARTDPAPQAPPEAPEAPPAASSPPPRWLVHAALGLVTLLFGVNFVGMKLVVTEVPAMTWAAFRILIATAILVPLTPFLSRGAFKLPRPRQWPALGLAALLGLALNQLLFAMGLERTTPGHASVIVATIPVLTLIAAVSFGDERIRVDKLLALGLCLIGVGILIDPSKGSDSGQGNWVGDLLTFLNASCYAVFLVYVRRAGQGLTPAVTTATCFAMGTVMLTVAALPNFEWSQLEPMLEPQVWPWALHAILGATVGTYLINVWALRHAESSVVALYIYGQPIVATGLSIALGIEALDPRVYLAALFVFAGVGLRAATQHRRQRMSRPARAT